MSLEALKQVVDAEEDARQEKLKMQEKAQLAIDEVEAAGKKSVATTLERAESEATYFLRAADQKATDEARVLASKTANRQAMHRARAERFLEKASDFIFERIVNG